MMKNDAPRKSYWYVLALLPVVLLFVAVRHVYDNSPAAACAAVRTALRARDRAALRELTTPQGFRDIVEDTQGMLAIRADWANNHVTTREYFYEERTWWTWEADEGDGSLVLTLVWTPQGWKLDSIRLAPRNGGVL